jgi:hypothetical protein
MSIQSKLVPFPDSLTFDSEGWLRHDILKKRDRYKRSSLFRRIFSNEKTNIQVLTLFLFLFSLSLSL